MSSMLKKLLLLSLALVLSFSLVAFVGCEESLSQEEIDQIIADISSAQPETVSFAMDVPMSLKVTGGSESGTMTVAIVGSGVMDMVNEDMQMTMDMTMDIPDEGEQDISAELYFVDDWVYMGMDVPELGGQWVKMMAEEEMWQQPDPIEQQIELLAAAVEVKSLGSETVNGVECYVFEIEPDLGVLSDMLQDSSDMGMGIMDFTEFDLTDMYKELSFKEWLAKDSYLPMKLEVKIVMEVGDDYAAVTDGDFDKMTIDVELNMDFYDYNQPVSIELPPEALDAEEMPLSY